MAARGNKGREELPEGFVPPVYKIQDRSQAWMLFALLVLQIWLVVPMLFNFPVLMDGILYGAGAYVWFLAGRKAYDELKIRREVKSLDRWPGNPGVGKEAGRYED